MSIYSKIYSTKSRGFESKNKYTIASIEIINKKFTGVFDRGYDNNGIIKYMDDSGNDFVIRMNDKRVFLFKGKKKNCYEEARKRKEKNISS